MLQLELDDKKTRCRCQMPLMTKAGGALRDCWGRAARCEVGHWVEQQWVVVGASGALKSQVSGGSQFKLPLLSFK